MENTVLLTLSLITLATLAVCLVSVVLAYLLQLDTSLALKGAVHVAATLPGRSVGVEHVGAHETALTVSFSAPVREVTPVCSRRTALNLAFDALMYDMDLQDRVGAIVAHRAQLRSSN